MEARIHIVLHSPQIPQNTASVGRTCVCLGAHLHLIRPLGFFMDGVKFRRAGLDYWRYVQYTVYDSWEDFLESSRPSRFYFFSTKGRRVYWEVDFTPPVYLVFGNEGRGLPAEFYCRYRERLYCIPMPGRYGRSLNLANAVSVVAYEALRRQLGEAVDLEQLQEGPSHKEHREGDESC
ncbi:MAG: tRNA (cytidine(34)-2'-O)-methyltransferase [Planctomycetota bacterium]|nr:MAG: tRNA (cytidine(34)-2'-O)-methyltransferase [Planctomycetota bacterium]